MGFKESNYERDIMKLHKKIVLAAQTLQHWSMGKVRLQQKWTRRPTLTALEKLQLFGCNALGKSNMLRLVIGNRCIYSRMETTFGGLYNKKSYTTFVTSYHVDAKTY